MTEETIYDPTWQWQTRTIPIFPFVTFTNIEGKEFVIERERIKHSETYSKNDVLDHSKTFVNFLSPNHKSKGCLHAIVDMPIQAFRDLVLRPAFEGILCEEQTDTVG